MNKVITYNDKSMTTKYWCELSDEEYLQLKKDFYKKPPIEEVKKEFLNLAKGGVKNSAITNYYFKDLMAKTITWYCKWSLEDVFNCKDLIAKFVAQSKTNTKLCPPDKPLIKNVETVIRLGGKGCATKPPNFPVKIVDYILNKYNVNNNWYDYSCGWGSRLLGALKHNINYWGTDPNYMLCERLEEMAKLYKETIPKCKSRIEITSSGSEIYYKEKENTIGLAFSSPPYYNLEDYKIGEQSYKEGLSYEDWLNNYIEKTVNNIYSYLIPEGYFLININNFKEYNLVSDVRKIIEKSGFKYKTTEILENIKRVNSNSTFNDNSEGILVFTK